MAKLTEKVILVARVPIMFLLNTFLGLNSASADSNCLFPKNIKQPVEQKSSSFAEDPFNYCFGDFANQKVNKAFRVDEYCNLNNVETQCREKFKKVLKKNGCAYESQPVVCDLAFQIRKLGQAPLKFTCAYVSPNCYTIQNSSKDLCVPGFTAASIPGDNSIKLCASPVTHKVIRSRTKTKKGKR